MRTSAKALGLLVVSFLAAIVLAVGSAFSAALAFGATALIVPGTGTPDATNVTGYLTNARDYYLGGTACTDATCTLSSIKYPASFFPLAFIPNWCVTGRCEKWDDSVSAGVSNLDLQLQQALVDPNEKIIIFGYSQGGAVVTNELVRLKDTLTPAQKAQIQVVVIGNVDNPAGGLFTRLGFLGRVPFFDVTTGLATPIDTGLPITSIRFEYDGVSDSPKYFGNPLAVANALAGFAYVHGTYLDPNENGDFQGLPDDYTPAQLSTLINDPANATFDASGNKYVLIPTKTLPIVRPFLDLAAQTGTTALVKPVVDLISPVLRVLIDLGYDRNENPGVNSPLSILPFSLGTNPIKVGLDLIAAVIQGIRDAASGGAALTPATTTPTPVSTLAMRSIAPQADVANAPAMTGVPAPVTSLAKKTVQTKSAISDALTTPVVDKVTTPVVDVPVVKADETVKQDAPKQDEAKQDAPKQDAPKQDDVKKDEAKQDDVKQDDVKQDDVKKDDVKKDDAKQDDVKKDDAKKDEPKKDADAGDAGEKKAA